MPDENLDPAEGQEPTVKTFTEEEVNKLLSRERDKLHGRLGKVDSMETELADLRKAEAARAKAEQKAANEAEAARKRADEAEMSAKELIDRRTAELTSKYEAQQNEWASRYQGLEQQIANERAVFDKERSFQELASYTMQAVNAHADHIAPELVDYITGNTREEIDASIARAVEKTNAILAGVQGAQVAARAAMPGVSTGGFTPTGPLEAQGATRTLSPEDIAGMSQAEYAALRTQPGMPGSRGKDKGIFG